MKKSKYLLLLIAAALILVRCKEPLPSGLEKPNIILIMADDIGIEGLGCYGGTSYQTPNLDRMAGEGLHFTHAYAQPLCTPTRIQLMTGKYNHRNWKCFGVLDPAEKTIGHLMSKAGYKTCISGKWQLYSYDPPDYPGAEQRRGTGMHPRDAGFDEYSLFHSLHTEDKGSRYANPTYLRNGELFAEVEGAYGEDHNVDFIESFLKKHKEEPVFVYYPMALPHGPFVPTPHSDEWENPDLRLKSDRKYYADMVEYMDFLVGRILGILEDLGLDEKTIVLFYADNGTPRSITSMMDQTIVDGGKGLTTQNGIRVPLIAYWPGKIHPATSDALVDASDFLPTVAELSGLEVPSDWHTDGISFTGILSGDPTPQREAAFFWYDPRPGWHKDPYTRSIFALDHHYKLFDDGRMYDIRGEYPAEKELDPDALNDDTQAARSRLSNIIQAYMQPPMSQAALSTPDAGP